MTRSNRRTFFKRAALLASALLFAAGAHTVSSAASNDARRIRMLPAQMTWSPAPAQVKVKEGIAQLPGGARLWYWDTGGNGEPIVLLHAATGSGASWEYQQPVLAQAGYRVIGYSRRGNYKSEPADPNNPGSPSGDLHELAEHLGLERFHLLGTAAGGMIALDYAVSHQDKLLSLIFANSLGGIVDEEYGKTIRHLLPPTFSQLPADFRELGPSYRAGYRAGVERWLHLHELSGPMGRPIAGANKITWTTLESLRVPALLITGDADLYMPPVNLRKFASHIRNSETLIFSEVGHSAYWEQPETFNREVLAFLKKHGRRRN